jgi:hypothetical protein
MSTDVSSAIRQTHRYWYDDGLSEIAGGVILVAIGLLFAFEAGLPPGSPLHSVSAFGLPLVVLVGGWLASRIVRAVKARVTYPRTGYVRYRTAGRKRSVAVAVTAAVAAALLVVWMLRSGAPARLWIPALDGLAVGAMLLYLGYTLDLRRFLVLAGVSVVVGFLAATRVAGEIAGSAWYFGTMGLILAGVGGGVLWRYLRHTEPGPDGSTGLEPAPAPEVAQ